MVIENLENESTFAEVDAQLLVLEPSVEEPWVQFTKKLRMMMTTMRMMHFMGWSTCLKHVTVQSTSKCEDVLLMSVHNQTIQSSDFMICSGKSSCK